MTVISISGELGSDGTVIAEHIAHSLGYHFADKKVIGGILGQYGLVDFGRDYDTVISIWSHFVSQMEDQRASMVDMLNRVILALAHHGDVVIVGRGSFAVLVGFADVLNVRIEAPLAIRVQRVMEQQKITEPAQAEAVVKESDQARKTFIDWYYRAQWDKSEAFDLVINTGNISPELATTWLVEAARALQVRTGSDERTADTIQVDSVLASVVSSELNCQVTHGS
jgi:cytidylate kinase